MAKRNDTEEHRDDELEAMVAFGPSIDDATAQRLEAAATTDARGTQRRLCLLACSRSVEDLYGLSVAKPEAFAEMLEAIEVFEEHAGAVHQLAQAAKARMRLAGGHFEA